MTAVSGRGKACQKVGRWGKEVVWGRGPSLLKERSDKTKCVGGLVRLKSVK